MTASKIFFSCSVLTSDIFELGQNPDFIFQQFIFLSNPFLLSKFISEIGVFLVLIFSQIVNEKVSFYICY